MLPPLGQGPHFENHWPRLLLPPRAPILPSAFQIPAFLEGQLKCNFSDAFIYLCRCELSIYYVPVTHGAGPWGDDLVNKTGTQSLLAELTLSDDKGS